MTPEARAAIERALQILLSDFRRRHEAALQVAAALDQIGKGESAREFAHALEASFTDALIPLATAYAEDAPAN